MRPIARRLGVHGGGLDADLEPAAELLARAARDVSAGTPAVITGGAPGPTQNSVKEPAAPRPACSARASPAATTSCSRCPTAPSSSSRSSGTLLAGGVAVPVLPHSTAERLTALARLCDARAVISDADLSPGILQALAASAASDARSFLTPAYLGGAGTPGPGFLDIDQPAYIQFTSGSPPIRAG